MKSVIAILLTLCFVVSLTSCKSGGNGEGEKTAEKSDEESKASADKEEGTASDGSEESGTEKGGSPTREESVKARILELLEIVKAGENEKAAKYIVYRGPDKSRKWKDLSDYGAEMEKSYVDRVCGQIKEILEKGEVKFVKFMTEKEGEGEWLIWQVSVGGSEKIFAMLDIKGEYALGDID